MAKVLPVLPSTPTLNTTTSTTQTILERAGQMFDRAPATLSDVRAKASARAIPFHAQLYIENKCNLKCQHCYESEDTHPTHTRMSLAEITDVLRDLAKLGCLQLTITGGEIFLRRDIFEILDVAKKLRFQITLFTSGYFIDEERADRLRDMNIGQVDISVYSDRAADHDAFTQIPGSWARSTRALSLLAERGVKATLKCVLTTFNVDRIDHIVTMAKDLGVDFQFDPNVRPRMNNDISTLRYTLSPKVLKEKVFSRRDLYPAFQSVSPERICRGGDFLAGEEAMCSAGSGTMAIGASGDVYPCGFFSVAVGNVKQTPLREIWERSALLNDIREMTYQKMSTCPSCSLKSACRPCMAYAQVENGDYRTCNSASKAGAEALMQLAESSARANEKAQRGKPLHLVGDTELPEADGTAKLLLSMFD